MSPWQLRNAFRLIDLLYATNGYFLFYSAIQNHLYLLKTLHQQITTWQVSFLWHIGRNDVFSDIYSSVKKKIMCGLKSSQQTPQLVHTLYKLYMRNHTGFCCCCWMLMFSVMWRLSLFAFALIIVAFCAYAVRVFFQFPVTWSNVADGISAKLPYITAQHFTTN